MLFYLCIKMREKKKKKWKLVNKKKDRHCD